jgi:uncharacterized coiled-coil protein SlyX
MPLICWLAAATAFALVGSLLLSLFAERPLPQRIASEGGVLPQRSTDLQRQEQATYFPDDGYWLPLQIAELRLAIFKAQARRADLIRKLHDLAEAAPAPRHGAGSGYKDALDALSRISEARATAQRRLDVTQARLDQLLLKYTDKHPDVIAARQELEAARRPLEDLKQKWAAAEAKATREGSEHKTLNALNLDYRNLQPDLDHVNAEIEELSARLKQLETAPERVPPRGHVVPVPLLREGSATIAVSRGNAPAD